MGDTVWNQVGHFVSVVAATALALGMIALMISLLRKLGWRGPVEVVGILERLLEGSGKDHGTKKVNIEYRGADGRMLDFGPYVKASIRNGHGGAVDLHEGAFCGCAPDVFGVGAICMVSVQDGIVNENVIVQLDLVKKVLFVESRFNQEQLLAALIGRFENIK